MDHSSQPIRVSSFVLPRLVVVSSRCRRRVYLLPASLPLALSARSRVCSHLAWPVHLLNKVRPASSSSSRSRLLPSSQLVPAREVHCDDAERHAPRPAHLLRELLAELRAQHADNRVHHHHHVAEPEPAERHVLRAERHEHRRECLRRPVDAAYDGVDRLGELDGVGAEGGVPRQVVVGTVPQRDEQTLQRRVLRKDVEEHLRAERRLIGAEGSPRVAQQPLLALVERRWCARPLALERPEMLRSGAAHAGVVY